MENVIGTNIRQLREAKCWTQAHLAEAAGVTDRTVQRAESGRAVAAESLQAIAGAFDVSVDFLRMPIEKAMADAKALLARHEVIELRQVDRAFDLGDLLGCEAMHFDHVRLEDEPTARAVATLNQALLDLLDIWGDLEPVSRHDLLVGVQQEVDDLKKLGLVVTAGASRIQFRDQPDRAPLRWRVLYVMVSSAHEPKLFLLRDKTAPISFGR